MSASLEQLAYEYLWDEVMSRSRTGTGVRRVLTKCCYRQLYCLYPDGDFYAGGNQKPCKDCEDRKPPPENVLEIMGNLYRHIAKDELALRWSPL